MPRPRAHRSTLARGELSAASTRLTMLEKAGLTPARCAELVRKIVEQAEAAVEGAMNPLSVIPVPDYHARMAAGKLLIQLLGANPPKSTGSAPGSSQVVVINEMPGWARSAPRQVEAKVIDSTPPNPA